MFRYRGYGLSMGCMIAGFDKVRVKLLNVRTDQIYFTLIMMVQD